MLLYRHMISSIETERAVQLRREAYITAFRPKIREGQEVTLKQARELLGQFNKDHGANLTLTDLFFGTFNRDGGFIEPRSTIIIGQLRLQEISEILPETNDPATKKLLESETGTITKAVNLLSQDLQ